MLLKMYIDAVTTENSVEVSQKTENETTIWSSNSILGYISEENKNTNSKIYKHPKFIAAYLT